MNPDEYRKYEFDQAMREYWDANLRGDVIGFQVVTYTPDRGRGRDF